MDPFQIVTEPNRRRILQLIWTDELPAGEIARHFDVTFGAVSQHLALLREAGYVTTRKDGTRRLYRADRRGLGPLAGVLESMWAAALDDLADAVEREA